MKFVLVVLVALGLTMAWQAAVVADNNQQPAELIVPADNGAAVVFNAAR